MIHGVECEVVFAFTQECASKGGVPIELGRERSFDSRDWGRGRLWRSHGSYELLLQLGLLLLHLGDHVKQDVDVKRGCSCWRSYWLSCWWGWGLGSCHQGIGVLKCCSCQGCIVGYGRQLVL